jgi:hypothetical protein
MHELLISSQEYEKALMRYPDLDLYLTPVGRTWRCICVHAILLLFTINYRRRLVEKAGASLSLFSGKPMQDWRSTDVSEPVIAGCDDYYAPMYIDVTCACLLCGACVRVCVCACVCDVGLIHLSWMSAGRVRWW